MNSAIPLDHPYYQQLRADFPALALRTVRQIGQGWDNVALEVNGAYVFRLPKDELFSDELRQTTAYEVAILRKLHDVLPIDIPDPQFVAPGGAYFGYPKLSGIRADQVWPNLNSAQKKTIFEAWVTTQQAIEVHTTSADAMALNIPAYWLADVIGSTHELLGRTDLSDQIRSFAQEALKRSRDLDVAHNALLLHNDFFLHNMLLDRENHLSALLDWSDCCTAPIERELSLWYLLPADECDELIDLYTARSGQTVNKNETKAWRYIEACSDLQEQLTAQDTEGIRESQLHIQRWLRESL